jgi:hypothetical protein
MPKTNETPPPTETGPRAFSVILNQIGDGDCQQQLSEKLHQLVKNANAQAKARFATVKGSLTLKINVVADETGVAILGYNIGRKDPEPRRSTTTFWVDKGGNLTVENPRQIELGLRDVSKEKRLKDAGGDVAPAKEA